VTGLPKNLQKVLWSWNLKDIDKKRDKNLIITQVFNWGNEDLVCWVLKNYSVDEIRQVVGKPRRGMWWKRVLNFWMKILDVKIRENDFEKAVLNINPVI